MIRQNKKQYTYKEYSRLVSLNEYIKYSHVCTRGSMPVSAHEAFAEVERLLNARDTLAAHKLWSDNVNTLSAVSGTLPRYTEVVTRLKRERNLLQHVLDNVDTRKGWHTLEKYTNCSDFLSMEYQHQPDAELCKVRAELLGEAPLRECATLLRDFASLPVITPVCQVADEEYEDRLFSSSATVSLDTWYPGLWGTGSKRVRFDVFDCMSEHGALVCTLSWDESVTGGHTNVLAVLLYQQAQKIAVYLGVKKKPRRASTNWMDQNFVCYTMHLAVQKLVDVARKMALFDPQYTPVMKRHWQISSYAEDVEFQPGKTDSGFYVFLSRVL